MRGARRRSALQRKTFLTQRADRDRVQGALQKFVERQRGETDRGATALEVLRAFRRFSD